MCMAGLHLFDRKLPGGNRNCEGKRAFKGKRDSRRNGEGRTSLCGHSSMRVFKDFRMRREIFFSSEEVINKGI